MRKFRHRKLVPALLSALIVLSIWSNAVAAVFCPHMMGTSDCCLMQTSHAHSHERAGDSGASMARDQTDDMQMANMDKHDMPMEIKGMQMSDMQMSDMQMSGMQMSDMQMSDMQMDDATVPQPKLDHNVFDNLLLNRGPNSELTDEAITQPNEPCSHCVMHSQSGASFPVSVSGQSNPTYPVDITDAASAMLRSVHPSLAFVELHDHGPPRSGAPLYVLVSSFRI